MAGARGQDRDRLATGQDRGGVRHDPTEPMPTLANRLERLERSGVLMAPALSTRTFRPEALRPGALARLLDERRE